jgi:opacity protein-like surface antigen
MRLPITVAAIALSLVATPSFGQERGTASVAGSVGAMSVDSRTETSLSAAFAFSFTRVAGLEIEATYVPNLASGGPDDASIVSIADDSGLVERFPLPHTESSDGRLVILSNNVRLAIPTTSPRFEPYFVAGGGIASIRQSAVIVYSLPDYFGSDLPTSGPTYSYPIESSSIEMALTIGGGLSVKTFKQMSIDADLRMFRLLGDEDRSVGRLGVGVRYRF